MRDLSLNTEYIMYIFTEIFKYIYNKSDIKNIYKKC